MQTTREKLQAILGPAIRSDPNVLKAQVFGEASVTDTQALNSLARILGAAIAGLDLLAEEIDDLRSPLGGR